MTNILADIVLDETTTSVYDTGISDGDTKPLIHYKQGIELATMMLKMYAIMERPVPTTVATVVMMALAGSVAMTADAFAPIYEAEEERLGGKSVLVYFHLPSDMKERSLVEDNGVFSLIPKLYPLEKVFTSHPNLMSRDRMEMLYAIKRTHGNKSSKFILFRFEYAYDKNNGVVYDMLVDIDGCPAIRKIHGVLEEDVSPMDIVSKCAYPKCTSKTAGTTGLCCTMCGEVYYCSKSHRTLHFRFHKNRCKISQRFD